MISDWAAECRGVCFRLMKVFRSLVLVFLVGQVFGEEKDLLAGRGFRPVEGWRGVEKVAALEGVTELLAAGNGRVMVNVLKKGEKAPYLFSREEFGDVRVEMEFMIPRGSNSGVYVMGRYEVQILDSWGRDQVGSGDLGGIYQRYDREKKKRSEGSRPKVNAARRPGQWQTMEIVFRAPVFDQGGKKLRDATFEEVKVNGKVVQSGASTSGPTTSAPLEGEVSRGPLSIQGDHGPIAIRKLVVTPLPSLEEMRLRELEGYWAEVSRAVREGDFDGYRATCDPQGILVSGIKGESYLLSKALKRWKKEFDDTRTGERKSWVDFRFSHRYGDGDTAHEAGIFRYAFEQGEKKAVEFVEFEALLRKREGRWVIVMEYQKDLADESEWEKLKG